jgi:hypothetical protein
MTVYTSTDIEGVKLTRSDLEKKRSTLAARLLFVNLQSPLDHRDKYFPHRVIIRI